MFIVCDQTLLNPSILETRSLPKKFFGRVQVIPRKGTLRLWARLILEMQLVRYLSALLPFVFVALSSRDLALPITQAPLAMLVVIAVVEMKVLRLSVAGREALMDEDEALRRLDTFDFRARACLRKLAAKRGQQDGELAIVCEQSELARVAPLTLLSVQSASPNPHVVDLDAGDRQILSTIFDDAFSERDLQRANLRLDSYIREVKIEAQSVSSHARLTAWLETEAVGN